MFRLLLFILTFPLISLSQNEITIAINNVPASIGNINVALYKTSEDFLKFDKVFKYSSATAKKGTTETSIKNIPDGKYAIAIFYDENSNNILDKNWLGIPKEKVAFSNARLKTFGPPSFEECLFYVNSNTQITIYF